MNTTLISDILHRLEETPNLLSDNWCVPRETGRFLYVMALTTGARNICEIGTSVGYSTIWLAQAAAQNGGCVDTLEYFESRQEQAKTHVREAGLTDTVQFHLGQATDTLETFKSQGKTFDLVFIDAAKKEYIDYIKHLETMLPTGGIVIADNTRSHRKEMQDFLDYMETSALFDVAEIESPNGQLIARKR
jgi:predicted O-methyltransferase YrrM